MSNSQISATSTAGAVGFDIGGTNIRGIQIDADQNVLATFRRKRPESPEEMIEAVRDMTAALAAESGVEPTCVGVGCAGQVDHNGVVRTSPNIPSMVQFPLREELTKLFDVPIATANDATAATWAEFVSGGAEGHKDVVFVAFGTGIGGGMVADGQLLEGAWGLAGEIGHMIIDPDGPACVCGRHGCWEQMASGNALGRLARDAAGAGRAPTILAQAGGKVEDVAGEHVAAMLLQGDPVAEALLGDLASQIAIGLNNLVSVLDPSLIIIGGGLSDIGDHFLMAIQRAFDEVLVDRHRRPKITVIGAQHGGLAGALGAALLASNGEHA